MAICREFYFPSSDGSSRIHAAEWTPESGEIIGVLQIAHGVAEYGMRYAPFAEFMTEHGRKLRLVPGAQQQPRMHQHHAVIPINIFDVGTMDFYSTQALQCHK